MDGATVSTHVLATVVHGTRRYSIIKIDDYSGIRWRLHYGDGTYLDSQGAFYDKCEDHPEGAVAWALAATAKDARKREEWCSE